MVVEVVDACGSSLAQPVTRNKRAAPKATEKKVFVIITSPVGACVRGRTHAEGLPRLDYGATGVVVVVVVVFLIIVEPSEGTILRTTTLEAIIWSPFWV